MWYCYHRLAIKSFTVYFNCPLWIKKHLTSVLILSKGESEKLCFFTKYLLSL